VSDSADPQRIIELETALLLCLCGGAGPIALRKNIERELAGHVWRSPEHGVVYEALARIREQDSASLREQLPSQATRMGFPDIDWAQYLSSSEPSARNLEDIVRELISESAKHS
jgi:hypothetical protein